MATLRRLKLNQKLYQTHRRKCDLPGVRTTEVVEYTVTRIDVEEGYVTLACLYYPTGRRVPESTLYRYLINPPTIVEGKNGVPVKIKRSYNKRLCVE